MAIPPRASSDNTMAGGFLIAVGAILGAFIGTLLDMTTQGFLLGCAAGAGMAIAIWLIDRRR